MLSSRGLQQVAGMDIPWRFAPTGADRYDKLTNPDGFIALGLAENGLMHDELQQYVSEKVKIEALAYTYRYSTMGGTRYNTAVAAHINAHFQPHVPIQPSQVLTGGGLTAIHEMVALSLGDPGDGILVSRPIYGRFELDFGNTAGLEICYADMNGVDVFAEAVVERYEEAFEKAAQRGVKIKAVLIVNPHNPLGRCYPRAALESIMAFCGKRKIHLISDEVYALSVFDNGDANSVGFTSALSIDPEGLIDANRLHVFYGMSKDFAGAGLRLGSIITQNSLLRKSLTAIFRFHNPSGVSVAIGTAILEDQDFVKSFISLSRERPSQAYRYATTTLAEAGISYHGGSNAGFFLYIDLSPFLPSVPGSDSPRAAEYALARRLVDGGVGLHPCEEHNEVPGHFRVVFSHKGDTLAEGLRRLIAIVKAQ